jgi:hypothetical protein
MRHLLFVLALSVSVMAFGQKEEKFINAEKVLRNAPDSVFNSTSSFAAYLDEQFGNDEDLLRGIFVWIAESVSYDVESMYRINFSEDPCELIERTFLTRKAICQGYAELFNELCHQTGIRSCVVHGYTKQGGIVSNTGHAWIVANSKGAWYCIDPTWGAGYLFEGKFVRSFSPEYFLVKPEEFITTHMPLDPMWQCLDQPFSIQDFYNGERKQEKENFNYAYADSINAYMQLTRNEKYEVTLRRIEEYGIRNGIILDYARFLEQSIENAELREKYEYQKQMVERLNEAVVHYNAGANLFNRYIHFYNQQFKPAIPDFEIRQMLDTCDRELKNSERILSGIDPFNKEMKQNLSKLEVAIEDLLYIIDNQKDFLRKYLSTSKACRGSIFRKNY